MGEKAELGAKATDGKRTQQVVQKQKTCSSSPVHKFHVLQRAIGNQAVEGLYRSGLIQAKLTIGAPNDIYEQEADRVADQVMRMPQQGVQRKPG
jgi:hypothetical protein